MHEFIIIFHCTDTTREKKYYQKYICSVESATIKISQQKIMPLPAKRLTVGRPKCARAELGFATLIRRVTPGSDFSVRVHAVIVEFRQIGIRMNVWRL